MLRGEIIPNKVIGITLDKIGTSFINQIKKNKDRMQSINMNQNEAGIIIFN